MSLWRDPIEGGGDMSEANPARPCGDTFVFAGATIDLVDAATILAAARVNPVELLRRAVWPAPVRRVDLRVQSADGEAGAVRVDAPLRGTPGKIVARSRCSSLSVIFRSKRGSIATFHPCRRPRFMATMPNE